MEERGGISTKEELVARLDELRQVGGEPFDFELAIRSLAAQLCVALGWMALLDIARVGLEAYERLPDLPSAEPPIFRGRPFESMPAIAPATDLLVPRTQRLEDESPLEYGEYLAEHAVAWLADHGVPRRHDVELAAAGYALLLCRDDFRRLVPPARTLDAHAMCLLAAERTMRQAGGIHLGADEEAALFRWLHLTTYAEVPPEYLREQAARRETRLIHDRQPASEVAVMTCELPVVDELRYDELVGSVDTTVLTADDLRETYRSLAQKSDRPERWAARAQGFEDTGQLDLTPAAAARAGYGDHVRAHLMRWMVEHDIPVRPIRMQLATTYAGLIVQYLVEDPAEGREAYGPVKSHQLTMYRIRRREEHVPLADELLFLAWLLCQRSGVGVKLQGFLTQRDLMMEKVARHLRGERS